MNILRRLAVVIVALGSVSVAQADLFRFSYQFDDGTDIIGSLNGNQTGDYVVDISNLTLQVNGYFYDQLDIWGYYTEDEYAISFDSSLANFWIADANRETYFAPPLSCPDAHIAGSNGCYGFALIGSTITTDNANLYGNNLAWVNDLNQGIYDTSVYGYELNSSWQLAKVPEPGTLGLLGIGLFGMGLARRTKQMK